VTGCRFVQDHPAEHAVKDLCRVIDLPRSTYYAWLRHEPSQRAWDDNVLLSEIKEIHVLSRHTYGAAHPGVTVPPRSPGRASPRGADHGRTRARGRARTQEVATGQAQHRLRAGPTRA
jgi:hypothetical protein